MLRPARKSLNDLPTLLGTSWAADASTPEGAMRVAAVYSCVRVISETVASLPLLTYTRSGERGKMRATTDDRYWLLHDQPNAEQTSFEFIETLVASLLLRGNFYAIKKQSTRGRNAGKIDALIPISADMVTVKVTDGPIKMITGYDIAGDRSYAPSEIVHIRALSLDGVMGRSVVRDASDTFRAAQAAQEYGRRSLENDATPSVVIRHPETLDEEAAKRLKDSWSEMFSGPRNAGRTAVLEEGMSIEKLSMTAEDLQFLDTRKLQRQEIAAIFRVPPHLIGDLSQSSFSNIEQQAIEFVVHCIRPWCVRIEQALGRKLFTPAERQTLFCEFLIDGLLRGDLKSRYDAYVGARQGGFLSVNDIRALENLNPIGPEGDVYLQPLNMAPAGAPVAGAKGGE